jgi:hypothetical protein
MDDQNFVILVQILAHRLEFPIALHVECSTDATDKDFDEANIAAWTCCLVFESIGDRI